MTAARERDRFMRTRWGNIGIYTGCCAAVLFVIFYYAATYIPSATSWVFAAGTMMTFLWLVHQELGDQPFLIGPHECHRCRKII